MKGVDRILVGLDFGSEKHEVGELVQQNQRIYFRYYPSFLQKNLNISPFKLPLNTQTYTGNPNLFEGLFGMFNDSLPDGWGRLLIDKFLANKGIPLVDVSPLDRLTFVGQNGMGALTYEPVSLLANQWQQSFDLDKISNQVQKVLSGESGKVIDELVGAGGSSGGARPKVFAGYEPKSNLLIYGTHTLPDDFEHWIVKFPSSTDDPDIAKVEMTYHKMAVVAGIKMNPCRLFEGKSKRKYFGTKRFDRAGHNKWHMQSASGLLHDDFRQSQLDYGHLLHNGYELTKKAKTYEEIFRLAAFNVYAHNRDDHSKNFSFLMDSKGNWEFSPAYDLTFSNSSHGMHSISVAGESGNPGKKQLMELAETFLIKKAEKIIEEVKEAIAQWEEHAGSVGLSNNKIKSVRNVLKRVANNDC